VESVTISTSLAIPATEMWEHATGGLSWRLCSAIGIAALSQGTAHPSRDNQPHGH
jgi:hypothetical protein